MVPNPTSEPMSDKEALTKHPNPNTKPKRDNFRMRRKLQRWRNGFNMADAIKFCRCVATYSVAILCAGGLLDTLGAVRAGFLPIWGTETCEKQRKLWDTITGAPMYPDTFIDIPSNAKIPIYMKSGRPCPDYTFRGPASRGQRR